MASSLITLATLDILKKQRRLSRWLQRLVRPLTGLLARPPYCWKSRQAPNKGGRDLWTMHAKCVILVFMEIWRVSLLAASCVALALSAGQLNAQVGSGHLEQQGAHYFITSNGVQAAFVYVNYDTGEADAIAPMTLSGNGADFSGVSSFTGRSISGNVASELDYITFQYSGVSGQIVMPKVPVYATAQALAGSYVGGVVDSSGNVSEATLGILNDGAAFIISISSQYGPQVGTGSFSGQQFTLHMISGEVISGSCSSNNWGVVQGNASSSLGLSYSFSLNAVQNSAPTNRILVAYNPTNKKTVVLNGNGNGGPTIPAGWSIVDVQDFNSDGNPDYVLFNATSRRTAVWYMRGALYVGGAYGPVLPSGWTLLSSTDLNGDGKPDFLLKSNTGRTAFWYLNGVTYTGGTYGPSIPAGYTIISPK